MRLTTFALTAAIAALAGSAFAAAPLGSGTAVKAGGGVLALPGTGSGATAGQVAPKPASFSPLTAAECTGLGGTVTMTVACMQKGRSACQTVDPNGIVRTVCLTK